MFISFWTPSPCKPVFNDKFYLWVCKKSATGKETKINKKLLPKKKKKKRGQSMPIAIAGNQRLSFFAHLMPIRMTIIFLSQENNDYNLSRQSIFVPKKRMTIISILRSFHCGKPGGSSRQSTFVPKKRMTVIFVHCRCQKE